MKSKKIPLYGLALMILRGSTADLDEAVKSKNIERILVCTGRLQTAKENLKLSMDNYSMDSYVQRTYKMIEDESAINADFVYIKAISFIRESLKLV